MKPRLGILLSGGGRTLQNLADCIARGELQATIAVVISSRGDAFGLERAKQLGLPCAVVEPPTKSTLPQRSQRAQSPDGARESFHNSIADALRRARVDLVCMAGFVHLWNIPDDFAGRVINIHPALLPDFGGRGMYGRHVHEAVLASGAGESGCTVHYCDNEYDHGPIILQRRVPVLPDDTPDTLAARVFEAECEAYPEAIRRMASSKCSQGRAG